MGLTPAQSDDSEGSSSLSSSEIISQSLSQSPSDSFPDSPPDSPRFIITSLDLSRSSVFDEYSVDLQQEDEDATRKEFHDNNDSDVLRSFDQDNYGEEEEHDDEKEEHNDKEEGYNGDEEEEENEFGLIQPWENRSMSDELIENIECGYCEYNVNDEENDGVCSQQSQTFSVYDYNTMPNVYDLFYSNSSQEDQNH